MDFLRENADNGVWFPGINDCHNSIDDALDEAGLENPGAPGGRFGPPENSSGGNAPIPGVNAALPGGL